MEANKKMFIESYGCAMNFSDSEIVASILSEKGYATTQDFNEADIILINTCAIRENAENKVRHRLKEFNAVKKKNPSLMIGVMGCMAERLKEKFLEEEKIVDIVVGPDSYRDLPRLMERVDEGFKAVNVLLSREETYADINPVRLDSKGVNAFISIMRGCDNMCSFCVVPFTRGRERSRDPESIVAEARHVFSQGYREVILLGQNVDSYLWAGGGLKKDITEEKLSRAFDFADLLERVAKVDPLLRVRFSTSHPKDLTDKVLEVMGKYNNICKYIHLPVQSGSSSVLERMNRGYTREWYLNRIKKIREMLPGCGISTDLITGFCGETEEDHRQTLSLMDEVRFDFAYMFTYSERPGTQAARKYRDDVPEEVKKRRINEIIDLQREHTGLITKRGVGNLHSVLVEGVSKKSKEHLSGRNSQNCVVVFPRENFKAGEYVEVLAESCSATALIGKVIAS